MWSANSRTIGPARPFTKSLVKRGIHVGKNQTMTFNTQWLWTFALNNSKVEYSRNCLDAQRKTFEWKLHQLYKDKISWTNYSKFSKYLRLFHHNKKQLCSLSLFLHRGNRIEKHICLWFWSVTILYKQALLHRYQR